MISSSAGALHLDLNASSGIDINLAINTEGGNFESTGVNFDNTGGAIITAGGNLTINHTGNVTVGSSLNSGAGSINVSSGGALALNQSLTTTSGGTIDLDSIGAITISVTGHIQSGGAVTIGGPLVTSGNITTSDANITFNQSVTLAGNVILDTGTGIGDVNLLSTVDGNHDFLIDSGAGAVLLGSLGQNVALASLTVNTNGGTTLAGNIRTQGPSGIHLSGAGIVELTDDVTLEHLPLIQLSARWPLTCRAHHQRHTSNFLSLVTRRSTGKS